MLYGSCNIIMIIIFKVILGLGTTYIKKEKQCFTLFECDSILTHYELTIMFEEIVMLTVYHDNLC